MAPFVLGILDNFGDVLETPQASPPNHNPKDTSTISPKYRIGFEAN